MKDIVAIIRSVGERTTGLVEYACKQEIDDVRVIRGMSLTDSTRELCRQAVDSGKKWVLMIGGDYIPRPGFIKALRAEADNAEPHHMFVKGIIRDRFLYELRGDGGGPMLQRVDLLRKWLDAYERIDNGRTTEAQFHKYLAAKGYASLRTKTYLALHDYEQHYRDIYRSVFVYGKKRRDAKRLYKRWKDENLPEFEVALYAHQRGTAHNGPVRADHSLDYGWSESPFAKWDPKPEIPAKKYSDFMMLAERLWLTL